MVVVIVLPFLAYWVWRLRKEATGHRQVRQSHEEWQDRLRTVHSRAKIGHWEADLETGRVFASEETCRIFGFAPGSQLSLGDLFFRVHPQDRERISRSWEAALQQGTFEVEHRLMEREGAHWVRGLAEFRFDRDGRALQAFGTVQDITDIRRAANDGQETNSFLQAITDAIGEGLFVLDKEGCCVYVNPECERLLGWQEDELLGRDLHQLVHVEAEECTEAARECPVLYSLRDGRRRSSEDELFRRKDTSLVPVRLVTVPLKENGVVSGAVVAFQDISERKRMESKLRSSEEQTLQLLESAPDAMLVSDADGAIIRVNRRTEQLFGYSREQLLGHPIEMLLPQQLRGRHAHVRDRFMQQARSGGEHPVVSGRELVGLTRDGREMPLEITLSPIVTAQGLNVVSSMRDISRRKRDEEQIRKLSRAVEQSPSTIVITDLAANIEFVNPAFTRITGYTREEVVGRNPRFLKSGDHGEAFYQEMWDTLLRGEVWREEMHNKRKDGTLYWELASISPIKNEAGRTTHYVAIKEDITARREAQEKLLESEGRLQALIEAIPDAVFFKDGEGRWRIVNAAGLALFDLQDKPWQGKTEMELAQLHPQYHEAHAACLASDEAAWRNGGVSQDEEIIVDEAGREHFFDVTKIPLFSPEGRRRALVIVGRDVTEQKGFQAQLQEAKEQAEAANHAKSAFLANMSHELRTPMNAVLGFASLLRESEQNPDNRRYLDAIQTAGKTLNMLIDDILDLSKIEAGHLELHSNAVELGTLLRELELILSHRATEKQLELWVEMSDAAAAATLLLDEVRLRQILLNLMGNAVKFTERGHVGVRAELQPSGEGLLQLTISVEDTGIGIAADHQNEIFDLFTQSKGQDPARYGGTGLGLAISRSLARGMGGEIRLESEPGRGSVFTLTLPGVEHLPLRQDAAPEGPGDDLHFAPAEILVVDDVAANRLLLLGLLGGYGFTLREAGNGAEALQEVKRKHPDLILMDVQMPVLGGLEATRRLKGDPATADIPVIAVTASVTSERKAEVKANCDGYVSKPVSKEALLESLRPHLAHVRRRAGG